MTAPLVRQAHDATNVLHSLIYFAPEAEQHFTAAGLEPGRMSYFAGRSAPMGAVGAGVVTATFYNFSPELVAAAIPRAWQLATPAAVIEARFAAVDAVFRRLLGRDLIASPDLITLAGLVREAAGACTPEGRPLYAGHADLPWPDGGPHLDLWHGLSLLREYRGDGHVAALTAAGLSGLEALVTHTATGQGFTPEFARASRGWAAADWDSARAGLVARGLLDAAGELTAAGLEVRAKVERDTDRMAAPPWLHLGDEATEQVVQLGRPLSRTVAAAGAFPADGVFARR
jgi:helix-turn-helix protein